MTVIVRRKIKTAGYDFENEEFLPAETLLTREERRKAEELDRKLKKAAAQINKEFDSLPFEVKKTPIDKWRWLGQKLDNILNSVDLIEQKDIDSHIIWPAIGQHLRKELKRGFYDRKRSGTKNDHYRKCWALATLRSTEWVDSWVGWDAFTDRGDQLVYSDKLLPILEEKFGSLTPSLSSREYQIVAKLLTKRLPTLSKSPIDVKSLSDSQLEKAVEDTLQEFIVYRSKQN